MKLQDKVDRFVNPLMMRGIKGLKWERRPIKKKTKTQQQFIQSSFKELIMIQEKSLPSRHLPAQS